MSHPTTWFVTGASHGLGLELVRLLLGNGDNVVATTRSTDRLTAALGPVDTSRLLAVSMDLSDEGSVSAGVRAARERFGELDVVVNNAGYGLLGAVEEITDAEARELFDVQVFGTWNVLRAVLPGMRAAGRGHLITVSSILGLTTFPGWGAYCAAKFAVEGLTGALADEVADAGLRVTLVEPGYLQTDFLRDSLRTAARVADGYDGVRGMIDAHRAMPGTQLGDPARAAAAIVAVVRDDNGPRHQLLGSDSHGLATARLRDLTAEVAAGRELALTTDITG